MEKRLFILLIAILAIVTGAKAQKVDPIDTKPTLTLEMYSGEKLTKEQIIVAKLIALKAELTVKENVLDNTDMFFQGEKKLFSIGNSKLNPGTVTVPTDVTWEYNIKPMSLSKTDMRLLAEAGITGTYAYIALNISVTINKTNFTDETFRNYVSENFDKNINNKGRLTEAEAEAVKKIDVQLLGISDLKGIEYFTELTELWCEQNALTSLAAVKNTKLKTLSCADNQLTTINLSAYTKLEKLFCSFNKIETLNVTNNTMLKELSCEGNKINTANMGTLVESLPECESGKFIAFCDEEDEGGNEITPEQAQATQAKGWTVMQYFPEFNKEVVVIPIADGNFPDAIFRSYVSNNCDTNGDGFLNEAEAEAVTVIYVRSKGITSLKGVEFFTKLEKLDCSINPLTELDVTHNTELKELDCGGTWEDDNPNQLTSLDVSKNTALTYLSCVYNKLTSLDVSKNTALGHLSCNGNQLKKLDVTNNPVLTYLTCDGNQLSTIDVSNHKKLTVLGCGKNQLTAIDISNNPALTYLSCDGNQLSSLDVSNQPVLQSIYCDMNAINGKSMEMFIKSLPRLSGGWVRIIDLSSSDEQNVITRTQVLAAKEKGWKVVDRNGNEYNGIIIAGDANGDGEVTAADVETISDYILGRLATDSWFDEESADVVDDGVVDIQDLTQLIKLLTE